MLDQSKDREGTMSKAQDKELKKIRKLLKVIAGGMQPLGGLRGDLKMIQRELVYQKELQRRIERNTRGDGDEETQEC